MSQTNVEERIDELEHRVEERFADLDRRLSQLSERVPVPDPDKPWWHRIVGIFRDDPAFEEAMRLGREYRESLRPDDNEDAAN
jgi:hypothetical protein